MNDNQNKNSNKNSNQNKNKKNFNGLLMLLGWAVVLTVVFNYLAAYSQQADTASSTHEISYSEFLELVEEGHVAEVLLTDGMLEIAPVEGTPMDLRDGLPIGQRSDEDFPQLVMAGGYDHNWCIDGSDGSLRLAARAWSRETGVVMETWTTQPGVQFYSGNYLDGCPAGKGGAPYAKRWGFCLETQAFPNAVNQPNFPSPVLKKGEEYRHKTVFRFSVSQA